MAHKHNDYEINGNSAVVFASYKNTQKPFLIDAADLQPVLSHGRWFVAEFCRKSHKWYVACRNKTSDKRLTYLHRFLTNPPDGLVPDHENGDGLDNRRSNLRVVTKSFNQYNRRGASRGSASGLRGVYVYGDRWYASIQVAGKNVRLGIFDDPIVAALRVQRELIDRGFITPPKVLADNRIYTSYESNPEAAHV